MTSSDLASLELRVAQARREIDRRMGFALALAERGQQLEVEVADLKEQVAVMEKATIWLNTVGEQAQLGAQKQIESLVTRGLQVVFGPQMSFHLKQDVRARQPVVDFVVRTTFKDGSSLDTEVWGATGGGLSAVVGFILRVVVLLLSRDKNESLIALDEPFANVSSEYASKLVEFIQELTNKTSVQFIIVAHTHVDELSELADRRYSFIQTDGATTAKEY